MKKALARSTEIYLERSKSSDSKNNYCIYSCKANAFSSLELNICLFLFYYISASANQDFILFCKVFALIIVYLVIRVWES
jgi:cadmium resistance protein CadD (predicted permease)